MTHWDRFYQAVQHGLPQFEQLQRIRQVEGWLDLPLEQALAGLKQATREASEAAARPYYQTLSVLRLKLQRDAGIPFGPEGTARLQELFIAVEQGSATEEQRRLVERLVISYHLSNALIEAHPVLGQGVPQAELDQSSLHEKLTALFPRFQQAAQHCTPGTVAPENVAELKQLLGAYQELASGAQPGNPGLVDVHYAMGHTGLMLARSTVLLGHHAEGRQWFGQAAVWFEQAGGAHEAADCRARLEDLDVRLMSDLDSATRRSLEALLRQESQTDLLEHAQALVDPVQALNDAGDLFEAERNAEAAAAELKRLGFLDPDEVGLDAALDSWIDTTANGASGLAFERRIHQVVTFYCAILGTRAQRFNRSHEVLVAVGNLTVQLQTTSATANAALERELAVYFPAMQPTPSPAAANPQQTINQLDEALLQLRQECNRRTEAGLVKDDLLEATLHLQTEAARLHMPLYDAKTRLERAYILLSLGRAPEVLALAQEARAALLAGRPAALASFNQSFERAVYMETLARQAMAQIIMGDFAGALQTCEATVRDFESERNRVSSPYQQSAFLGSAAQFYTWGAFAAFKLERWDTLIAMIDLVKARSAVRSRLVPETTDVSVAELSTRTYIFVHFS